MSKILLIGAEPDRMPRLKLMYKCLRTLGHDVKVFAPFQKRGSSFARYLANMVKLLFERADEYHFFNIPDIIGLPLLFKRGRLIYDIRSPWREIVFESTKNKIFSRIAELIERIFCLKADVVISSNPLLGERAISFGARETTNVPNFLYKEMNTEGWQDLLDVPEATVLFFGKISISEGSNVLADVIIRTLKTKHNLFGVRFLIAGDGPELVNLKKRIADAGVENNVTYLGWVPHDDIGMWIRAVDLCIMPREEGGSMKWLHPDCIWKVNETVSIGTPIIATRYGGFNDDTVFHPLLLSSNKDFPAAIYNVLEAVLRWGRPKSPMKRDWTLCIDKLENVYGRVKNERRRRVQRT